jgi:hypothetical protein
MSKISGQARRPAPTKARRGDPLWSPGSTRFDFDASLGEVKRIKIFFIFWNKVLCTFVYLILQYTWYCEQGLKMKKQEKQ